MMLLAFFATSASASLTDRLDANKPRPKKYPDIDMSELRQGNKRAMVVCPQFPTPGERYPLIGYAHGDTVSPNSYRPAMQMMADFGFCSVAYRSCQSDSNCDDGRADFIELLKMIKHLDGMEPSDDLPLNMSAPISMAGHSTGGREALIIAALKSPDVEYLKGMPQEKLLTPDLRAILPRIKVVCADHPDEMYPGTSFWSGKVDNPDPARFRITETPVIVWTGSDDDWIEPTNSTWRDFADYIESPERVFIDIRGEGHMRVMGSKPFSPFTFVQFIRLYAFGNETAASHFYGNPPGVWSQTNKPVSPEKNQSLNPRKVPIATKRGDQNAAMTATEYAGYVACSKKYGQFTVPEGNTGLCNPNKRFKWIGGKEGQWDIPPECRVTVTADGKYMGTERNGKVPKKCWQEPGFPKYVFEELE